MELVGDVGGLAVEATRSALRLDTLWYMLTCWKSGLVILVVEGGGLAVLKKKFLKICAFLAFPSTRVSNSPFQINCMGAGKSSSFLYLYRQCASVTLSRAGPQDVTL